MKPLDFMVAGPVIGLDKAGASGIDSLESVKTGRRHQRPRMLAPQVTLWHSVGRCWKREAHDPVNVGGGMEGREQE